MARVITFSRKFPSYHDKKGAPTYFVEKFLNTIGINYRIESYLEFLYHANKNKILEGKLTKEQVADFYNSLVETKDIKKHTMRSGNRYKLGELFSPRVWSNKPYCSPQIIFAPDSKIKEHYNCVLFLLDNYLKINQSIYVSLKYKETISKLALNDGLSLSDFNSWFNKDFNGQIICWEEVHYEV